MLSASLRDLLRAPRLANVHRAVEAAVVFTKPTAVCEASRCFVSQAEHLICGEVLELSNSPSANSLCVLHCVTLFDIIRLEVSVCSIMNTDCSAIGVIAFSVVSQCLKSEKSVAQLN